MNKLVQELRIMLEAGKNRVPHKWHGKDLTQVVNLAYIHDLITREEKDAIMPAAVDQPYNIQNLISAAIEL